MELRKRMLGKASVKMPPAGTVQFLAFVIYGTIPIMYDAANYSNTKYQRGSNCKFTTRTVTLSTIPYAYHNLSRHLSQTSMEEHFTDLNREEDLYTQRIEEDKKLNIDF